MNYAYYRSRFPLPVYRGPNPPEGEWMTVAEAAKHFGVSPQTIRLWTFVWSKCKKQSAPLPPYIEITGCIRWVKPGQKRGKILVTQKIFEFFL